MDFKNRLKGCLIGGAIGDSIGGRFEGRYINLEENTDFNFEWRISDDTQLTLATCEAIFDSIVILPEKIAARFLHWFNNQKLTGLGSSTLKALRDLQIGAHWALAGRTGEYAAGNGAAMRIAPLAFKKEVDRQLIRDVCNITHKNDEAYAGALAIYYSILFALNGEWKGENSLIAKLIDELPDTRVRDRFIEIEETKEISIIELGQKFKPTGYVVDSVPISVFAAQKICESDFKTIITDLVKAGGDTDTTCSMAGQIMGTLIGEINIPQNWVEKYTHLGIHKLIVNLVSGWK